MADRKYSRYSQETATRRRYSNYNTEIHGNAVVRPDFFPEEEPEERPERKRLTSTDIEKRQRQAHDMAFGFGSFILVTLSLLFVCYALFMYLGERGEMHSHTKVVKSLETELNEKTVLNDNKLVSIEASVNYTEIYNRAVNELNMKFPGKNQVVWFTTTESEYISQYEAIPKT